MSGGPEHHGRLHFAMVVSVKRQHVHAESDKREGRACSQELPVRGHRGLCSQQPTTAEQGPGLGPSELALSVQDTFLCWSGRQTPPEGGWKGHGTHPHDDAHALALVGEGEELQDGEVQDLVTRGPQLHGRLVSAHQGQAHALRPLDQGHLNTADTHAREHPGKRGSRDR